MTTIYPIRLALPSKGHLFEGAFGVLETAGYKIQRSSDRQYEAVIVGHPQFQVVLMRPGDIVSRVQEGRCHLGVTGLDVYAERAGDNRRAHMVLRDLGYGGSRLVVAVPEAWAGVNGMSDLAARVRQLGAAGRALRVSTKYPTLAAAHFRRWGVADCELVDAEGTLELHPSLGLADLIVDLTSSGATLRENRLREIVGGTVLESSACLIGHAPSLATLLAEGENGPLAQLLDAIDVVRASAGWLHLEVVGELVVPEAAAAVADFLRERGARHIVRDEVQAGEDAPGWRVAALLPARALAGLNRPLLRLGAVAIVGTPARHVCHRDHSSTFDLLAASVHPAADACSGDGTGISRNTCSVDVPIDFSRLEGASL